MSIKTIFTAFLLSLVCHPLHASLRTDLAERTPEDVFKKSVNLGKTLPCAGVVGAVSLNDGENIGTGIALDRHTILTAAHFDFAKPGARIEFILSTNLQGQAIKKSIDPDFDCMVYEIDPNRMHVHDRFRTREAKIFSLNTDYALNAVHVLNKEDVLQDLRFGPVPVKDLGKLSFEICKKVFLSNTDFCGVDLLILKTKKSLPKKLPYPKFLAAGVEIREVDGISVGFGHTVYNRHPNMPQPTSQNVLETNQRHVISCKVSSSSLEDGNEVFFGTYKGLFINGDESFIPKSEMLMTAALPVGGDSGGPFFIKKGESYVLGGILSQTLSPMRDVIGDPNLRSLLGAIEQPVFPIWQDIRPYLPWIKSHLEK
jgi:hypothetical protein